MRSEPHRRPRRHKARRTRARDLAVLAYPAKGDGPMLLFGPFTRQGALAVSLRELSNGRKVQIVPFDRVRALESA